MKILKKKGKDTLVGLGIARHQVEEFQSQAKKVMKKY